MGTRLVVYQAGRAPIILLSSIVLWFLQGYGFVDGVFQAVEDNNSSLLALIGNAVSWIFYPLGWIGDMAWKATVATVTGLSPRKKLSIPSVSFTITAGN